MALTILHSLTPRDGNLFITYTPGSARNVFSGAASSGGPMSNRHSSHYDSDTTSLRNRATMRAATSRTALEIKSPTAGLIVSPKYLKTAVGT